MKKHARSAIVAIALALPMALAGSPAYGDKEAPPKPGQARDFKLPAATTFTLDNGLAVTLVPFGEVPKVALDLVVRAGNVDETADQVWLSRLTARLLQEGTATKSAADVALAAARMGGSLDVSRTYESTELRAEVLSEFGPAMIDLIAEVAEHPKLPESEVPRLKADMQRSLSMLPSEPPSRAARPFAPLLYPVQLYSRAPTPAMIEGFTGQKAKSFYEAFFSAARSHLYVVGRFDAQATERAIRGAFSGWKAGAQRAFTPAEPTMARAVHLLDRPGAVQSVVIIGLPVIEGGHPDAIKLAVANMLLGGSYSSRIMSYIREQKGCAYASNNSVSNALQTSYLEQWTQIMTNVTAPALKDIFAEIKRLQAEAPTEAELRAVKSYMLGRFVLRNSSRGNIIDQLAFIDLHRLPKDYLSTYVSKVLAVTPEDVRQMTAKYIDAGKARVVVVGDKKIIAAQLKPFGDIK